MRAPHRSTQPVILIFSSFWNPFKRLVFYDIQTRWKLKVGLLRRATAAGSFQMTVCGIGELPAHCQVRISHVVSILDTDWPVPSEPHTIADHEWLELRFDDVIEPFRGKVAPGFKHIQQLLD